MKNGKSAYLLDNSVHGEDGYLVRELSDTACLDVVLDGVSRFGGKEAAELAAETLQRATFQKVEDLFAVLQQINANLYLQGGGRFLMSTIVVTLKLSDELHIVRAGDSLAYVVREGAIYETTPIAEGPYATAITGGLGFRQSFSYSYSKMMLRSGDRLVLMTDGIADNLALEELVSIVNEASAPQGIVDVLQGFINEKKVSRMGPTGYTHVYVEDDRSLVVRFF